jgi:hypothetical protein
VKITIDVKVKTDYKKAEKEVTEASRLGMRDTVVAIHNDSVKGSPVLTGHNRRSLASEVSGMGTVIQGADAKPEKVVDDKKIEGAVYSTSGYGGYLETGTTKMDPRPYIKPAGDKHSPNLSKSIARYID